VLGLRAHDVCQFEQMAQRWEFAAARAGSDRFHLTPLCRALRRGASILRAPLSDCLLVARKFCTVFYCCCDLRGSSSLRHQAQRAV
jgi:hypothetical protein